MEYRWGYRHTKQKCTLRVCEVYMKCSWCLRSFFVFSMCSSPCIHSSTSPCVLRLLHVFSMHSFFIFSMCSSSSPCVTGNAIVGCLFLGAAMVFLCMDIRECSVQGASMLRGSTFWFNSESASCEASAGPLACWVNARDSGCPCVLVLQVVRI